MTGEGFELSRVGIPSRLGRGGGTFDWPMFEADDFDRTLPCCTISICGDFGSNRMDDSGVRRAKLEAEFLVCWFVLEEIRIAGVGDQETFFFATWLASVVRSAFLIVEDEDEEVIDSRTAGSPLLSNAPSSSRPCPASFRCVTGGRLVFGLPGLVLVANLEIWEFAGEWEEADVVIEAMLQGLRDSDWRVEALLLRAKFGVGGFGSGVDVGKR